MERAVHPDTRTPYQWIMSTPPLSRRTVF